ncbi:hypothetical protein ACI77O_13455 [Pseudomonas tritici]|uniref:hypothetical protein n=1 Tax=Pseudomonas tritici TaxID=2745518 RepID=UPI00387B938E
MHITHVTATAVEKLKLKAKAHRNFAGCTLAVALDHVAAQAGYPSWKRVTELAANPISSVDPLLAAQHRTPLVMVMSGGKAVNKLYRTVPELCEALGGVIPVLIRLPCEYAADDNPCLCQVDPFATAMRANVALDIGDKWDTYNYLFDLSNPAREYPAWEQRRAIGLATAAHYPNEHLTRRGNDDRSNTLNPNNPAHAATATNRAAQLNPNNPKYLGQKSD